MISDNFGRSDEFLMALCDGFMRLESLLLYGYYDIMPSDEMRVTLEWPGRHCLKQIRGLWGLTVLALLSK